MSDARKNVDCPHPENAAKQDSAREPSASAISHCEPVAWVAFAADASESRALFLTREAAERAARKHGWFVAKLFAKPTLTGSERACLHGVAEDAAYRGAEYTERVVRGLLDRLK